MLLLLLLFFGGWEEGQGGKWAGKFLLPTNLPRVPTCLPIDLNSVST